MADSSPKKDDDAPETPSLEVFLDTQKRLLATLSDEEKTALPTCQSSTQLLAEIRKFGVFSSTHHERRLLHSLEKVQKFTELLKPYFDAIGIIVQSHPEIAGIIWGIMRGVLLVTLLYQNVLRGIIFANGHSLPVTILPFLKSLQIPCRHLALPFLN